MLPTVSSRGVRASLFTVLLLLALTAHVATSAPDPLPWCTTIPLPQADIGTVRSDVDSRTIHDARAASCRVLYVRGPRTALRLAVAATEAQRERGLMGISYVPAGQGMLFAFDGMDTRRYFWMKDTIAPLDMVFVKGDGTISAVASHVPATKPGTPDEVIARRDGVGRYVIELGAGEAERLGIVTGARLLVPAVEGR